MGRVAPKTLACRAVAPGPPKGRVTAGPRTGAPFDPAVDLAGLEERIVGCRACPRLVDWRESVAAAPRASFAGQEYWGRPLPGFGDPGAALFVVGLAPAAHGGNRTGRMFTGDRSGDWLYGAMWKAGFANQPTSVSRQDGLELRDAWVCSVVRCAPPDNRPTVAERDECLPYLAAEMALLERTRVIVALGAFAYENVARILGVRPRPRFGHLVELDVPAPSSGVPQRAVTLLCSYHPSQRNTSTKMLTEPMLDAVFERAATLLGGRSASLGPAPRRGDEDLGTGSRSLGPASTAGPGEPLQEL